MARGNKSILINGSLNENLPLNFALGNRGFLLGDGFFETVRVLNGRIFNWPAHYARIVATCKALKLHLPSAYTSEFFQSSLRNLLVQNEIIGGGRIRITFYREGKGAYAPETNKLGFVAEVHQLNQRYFQVKDKGTIIGIYPDMRKAQNRLANFKLSGNHIYIQAASWGIENNIDEAIILNEQGSLIETTSCNIFIIVNGKLHTPPLSAGCVAGTMRMAVVNAAISAGYRVYESLLKEEDIVFADEVFLTNAIKGISWVGGFKQKRYYHKISDQLLSILLQQKEVSV